MYLNWPDYSVNIKETLKCLNKFYINKKFKYFGLSNFAAWQVTEIYYICKEMKYDFVPTIYQGMYNPITREIEHELINCLRHLNINFYSFNILAGGLLTGKHKNYQLIDDCDNKIEKGRFHGTHIKSAES